MTNIKESGLFGVINSDDYPIGYFESKAKKKAELPLPTIEEVRQAIVGGYNQTLHFNDGIQYSEILHKVGILKDGRDVCLSEFKRSLCLLNGCDSYGYANTTHLYNKKKMGFLGRNRNTPLTDEEELVEMAIQVSKGKRFSDAPHPMAYGLRVQLLRMTGRDQDSLHVKGMHNLILLRQYSGIGTSELFPVIETSNDYEELKLTFDRKEEIIRLIEQQIVAVGKENPLVPFKRYEKVDVVFAVMSNDYI